MKVERRDVDAGHRRGIEISSSGRQAISAGQARSTKFRTGWPQTEQFGLTAAGSAVAVSIPSNIARGMDDLDQKPSVLSLISRTWFIVWSRDTFVRGPGTELHSQETLDAP